MSDLRTPRELDPLLGPVLRRATGDAWSRIAAVVARGLELGIPSASIRYWLRARGDVEVQDLASSADLMRHLNRKVRDHRAEQSNPELPIRRALAALLSPGAQMRASAAGRASVSALALVALVSAQAASHTGGRVSLSGDSAAVVLGCTPVIARRRLQLLTEDGALRRRGTAGMPGLYALAKPKRRAAVNWAESEAATELVGQVLSGDQRTWLHAFLSPALAYGTRLRAADVWLLLVEAYGLGAEPLGLEERSAQRSGARLRAVGAHDLESLLAALTELSQTPGEDGRTPVDRRLAAQAAYEERKEQRLAEVRAAREVSEKAWANVRKIIARPPAGLGYPPRDQAAARAWCERVHGAVAAAQGHPARELKKSLQTVLTSAVHDRELARDLAAVCVRDEQLAIGSEVTSEPSTAHVAERT